MFSGVKLVLLFVVFVVFVSVFLFLHTSRLRGVFLFFFNLIKAKQLAVMSGNLSLTLKTIVFLLYLHIYIYLKIAFTEIYCFSHNASIKCKVYIYVCCVYVLWCGGVVVWAIHHRVYRILSKATSNGNGSL